MRIRIGAAVVAATLAMSGMALTTPLFAQSADEQAKPAAPATNAAPAEPAKPAESAKPAEPSATPAPAPAAAAPASAPATAATQREALKPAVSAKAKSTKTKKKAQAKRRPPIQRGYVQRDYDRYQRTTPRYYDGPRYYGPGYVGQPMYAPYGAYYYGYRPGSRPFAFSPYYDGDALDRPRGFGPYGFGRSGFGFRNGYGGYGYGGW